MPLSYTITLYRGFTALVMSMQPFRRRCANWSSRLAAHLFEATGDNRYLATATSSAEFIQAFMFPSRMIVDTYNVSGCRPVSNNVRVPWTYTTGFSIWGISVVASHNESWSSL